MFDSVLNVVLWVMLVLGVVVSVLYARSFRVPVLKDVERRYRGLRRALIIYGFLLPLSLFFQFHRHGLSLFDRLFLPGCTALVFGFALVEFLRTRKKYLSLPASARRAANSENTAFFWQVILILLPVVGLATFGLYSLRQDRMFAEQEARETSQTLAQRLVQAIQTDGSQQLHDYAEAIAELDRCRTIDLGLVNSDTASRSNSWEFVQAWQQANPEIELSRLPPSTRQVPYSGKLETMPPQPAEWLRQLDSQQQQLWQVAKGSELVDSLAVQMAIQRFLASKPPPGARANAEYLSLLAKTHGLPPAEAAGIFAESKWIQSDQVTEAGLPVGQLIWYQRLRLLTNGAGLSAEDDKNLNGSIVHQPSFFSPRVIAEAERVTEGTASATNVAVLKAWWVGWQNTRLVFADFCQQHPTNTWKVGPFWVKSQIGDYLVVIGGRASPETNGGIGSLANYQFFIFPGPVVKKALALAMTKSDISVPPYARADFEFGGTSITVSPTLTGTTTSAILRVAHRVVGQMDGTLDIYGPYPFHVQVFLDRPDILYARQWQRTWLFGGLIVASAIVALLGLIAARRAFNRQLQLNEQKSNFVSSVSHELRAPIAAVRLMAENLERGKVIEPARQGEYFRHIVQECRRLSALIENVLDFSRIEQGRKQYEFDPTNLVSLVETTTRLMEPYAAEKGVSLKLQPLDAQASAPNIELNVDGRAIQQALVNLIDNAVKHSPKGETVTVGIETAETVAGIVRLYVADHGPGIPVAERQKIFERFYRLGSELRRETQGAGIGLSVVKHIVEAHGGCVRVASSLGQGSRFTIELPAK
jgi:signal transduction histidine kinase